MNRNARWVWLVASIAVFGAALVLSFVLSLTGQSEGFYERNFIWLFWLNVAVGGVLFVVIAVALARLVLRQRRGKFGTRLLTKLAGIFALVGLLPGLVIYTVSYQFVSRSIEIWFDVKVATALDAGLALGKGTLESLVAELGTKTRQAAERMGDERLPVTPLSLERLREQLDVRDLALLGANGQILISAGGGADAMAPERPSAEALRQARALRVASQIDGLDEEPLAAASHHGPRVRALALVRDTEISLKPGEERFLLAVQPVPRQLAANALAVQTAYSEYQQRALARNGLRRMYIGTLTLALVLSVFGAVLLAALLGNQLVRPLLLLADGVRQVAAGDLSSKPVFASRDELGGLTRSFADMTAQLADAREEVQRGVTQLEGARTRLQTILDNLTAGVVVFDREGRIDTVNPGATRILRLPLSVYRGRRLDEVPELGEFSKRVWQRFELHATSPEAGERDHWQEAFELRPGERDTQMLLVRGATLPDEGPQAAAEQPPPPAEEPAPSDRRAAPGARLMVFDDITEVVSAQRSAAWSEVARRLAHEIKNPLTPIQLSAERLQHKLQPKLDGSDEALLVRSVATIVNQVQSMKQLVNEFRDYARLPAAQLTPLDLNALVGRGAGAVWPGAGAGPAAGATGRRAAADHGRRHAAAAGGAQPRAERAGRRGRQGVRPGARGHLGRAGRKRRAACGAPDRHRQWPGLCRERAAARLRALHHHQEQGHRPGPGGGEEDRRRAPRHGAHRQPARCRRARRRRRGGARRKSIVIIFFVHAHTGPCGGRR